MKHYGPGSSDSRNDADIWVTGWETGNGVQLLMRFDRRRHGTSADQARYWCHRLIDYLPDDEIEDIKADLLDKSSIYMTLDRDRIPLRLEQENSSRKRRGTFGPVVADKP